LLFLNKYVIYNRKYVISNIKYVIYNRKIFKDKILYQIMTTIEEHKKILEELEEDINEKIRAKLLSRRQKIIGFTTSEASTNLFALFLHIKNLIPPGLNINHRFFVSSKRAEDKFKFNFPRKEEILSFMVKQEEFRTKLCYGKDKEAKLVEESIKNFFKLKSLIEKEIKKE